MSEYCVTVRRFLQNHGNIATEGSRSRDYDLLFFRTTENIEVIVLTRWESFAVVSMRSNAGVMVGQRRINFGVTLDQRLRRWPNVTPELTCLSASLMSVNVVHTQVAADPSL